LSVPEASPTVDANIPDTSPEVARSFSRFEVTAPTNLPAALESVLSKDTRYNGLNDGAKDMFLYQLFMKHYIEPSLIEGKENLFKDIGIASNNPFKIEGGILELDGPFTDEDTLKHVYADVQGGKVSAVEARDFRKHLSKLAEENINTDPADLSRELIQGTLKRLNGL
jgi:hypothetical protein